MNIRNHLGHANGFLALTIAGTVSLLCCWTQSASGQSTWIAGGGNTNWSTAGNWSGNSVPASGAAVTFNDAGGTTSVTAGTTSVVQSSYTIGSLTFANTASYQNLSIPSGGTLSITGAGGMTVGSTANSTGSSAYPTVVDFSGAGGLAINNASANMVLGVGNTAASAQGSQMVDTLNMSGLSGFTFSGSDFSVGALSLSATSRSTGGICYLASTSSITTGSGGKVDVGDSTGATNNGGASALFLSGGATTIDTNTLYVATYKASGTMDFAAPGGSVLIRGTTGGNSRVSTFTIGNRNTNTSTNVYGTVDFSGGQVDAMIGTLTVGNCNSSTSSGYGYGTFVSGTNANSLVDVNTVNVAAGAGRSSGTLQMEGGTFAFGTLQTSNGTACTILFQGGTICSNSSNVTASESLPFHLGLASGAGTVAFGALTVNPYSGITYNGTLNFTASSGTLDGSTTLQPYVQTTIGSNLSDGVNGPSTLTMAGPGLLILGGSASSYSGGTTVQGGTLQLGNANALGSSSGTLGVNGGTLDLHGNSPSVGAVTLAGGSIINSGIAATLNGSGYTLQSGTASAALGGAGAAVAMNGPGFVLLSGANTYGGGTTVSAGTLQLGNPSALGTPNGTVPLTVNGGLLDLNSQTVTTGGLTGSVGTLTSTANAGVLVLVPTSPGNNFSGTITGNAGITLSSSNGATQTLSGANSYSGPTLVNSGTLALVAPGTLGTGVTAITPGATLDVSNYNPGGYNFTSGTLAAGPTPQGGTDVNGSLNVTGAILSITGGSNSTMTINGNLALTSGTVSLAQGSTIALTGGGALSLFGTDVIAPTALMNTGTYTLFTYSSLAAGGTADLAMGGPFGGSARQHYTFGTSGGTAVTLTVSGFSGNLQWNGGSGVWYTGTASSANWYNLSTSAADYFYGGDNVTFNDTTGGTQTVTISGIVAPGTLSVANTSVPYTFSGNGSIQGSTSLNMTGPGTLTINTSNSYTGGTSLGGGLLNLGNSGALGSGTLTISGGSLDNTSGAAMTLAGNIPQAWNNNFTFVGSNPLNMGTGPVTMGTAATVTVSGTGALTVAGAIGDGGNNYSLTVPGPGTLVLAASNTFGGGTNLNGGLLVINNNGALGSGSLTISGGSIDATVPGIVVAGNPQNWNADFTFVGSNPLNLGTGAVALGSSLTVTVNANTLTVAGAISDGGSGFSLTKAGPGTLNLGGQNTYAGDTMIAQGTLQVGNTAAIPTGAGYGNVDFTNNASLAVLDLNGMDITINGLSQPTPSTTNLVVNNLVGTHTLTVGNNDATSTFAGILENNTGSGGTLALAKIGAGVLTLGGTNTYSGNTSISAGTLNLLTGTTLPSTTLNFSGTSVVNLNGNSQKLANMTFADNTSATIAGAAGASLTCSPANLAFEPATSAAAFLTVNMASVGAFTYNNPTGTLQVSQVPSSGGTVPATITVVTLSSGTDAITAATLNVGSNESGSTVQHNTLNLGASSTLQVNTINVGASGDRPEGTVEFTAGLVNPVLTITGVSGGTSTANLTIGSHDSNTTGSNGHYTATDLFDTHLGTLDAQLGNVVIGQEKPGTSGSVRWIAYSSTLNMGAGALTANSMSVGLINSGGTGTAYEFSASGAFNLTGGTANITTLTLATNNFVYALSTSNNNTLSGQVTLNNGNLYATTIQEGPMAVAPSGTLNVTSQINWNGGTIGNLTSGSLTVSIPSIVVSGTGEQDAFYISTGQTGAVNSMISGSGAIANMGPGTLILSGTDNNFTGGLYVANGTVILTNNEAVADGESLTVGNASAFSTIVPAGAIASAAPASASPAPVPEPGTPAILAAMLAGAAIYRRTRRK